MAGNLFNAGADGLTGGTIAWTTDTIKGRLVASSVTPNKDDASMTPYAGIGADVTLGSKARTKDNATDRIVYTAGNPSFTAVPTGSTVGWLLLFKFVTNDAGSTPIAACPLTATPTNGGDMNVTFDAAGAFYLQQ
jgi:hypothetical protein